MALFSRAGTKRVVKLAAGWGFVVLGLVGLVLPILQGFLFLGIGLYLLADESVWARRCIAWLRGRYPRHAATFDESHERARAWAARHVNRVRNGLRNNRG